MENGNGHPVTKSELQAILQVALSAQREDFHASFTAQKEDFRAALTAQKEELRAALTAQRQELRAELQTQRLEFQSALTAQKDELLETIRDVETNLLTSFHNYARDQQARLHSLEISDRDLVVRLQAIEDRLLFLESKQPPSV
jgi:hypothetical protein